VIAGNVSQFDISPTLFRMVSGTLTDRDLESPAVRQMSQTSPTARPKGTLLIAT